MFESIGSVDWKKLEQAHGDASHVPKAIEQLISEDEEKREKAYWKLDNHVVLQSDLYEAAFYVIPFLLEILRSNISVGREHVYALLAEIANGYASEEVTVFINGNRVPLSNACRNMVLEHVDIYLDEVQNQASRYRDSALDLLMSLSEKSAEIKTTLNSVLASEQDQEIRALVNEVLEELEH
ncbi:hypothetical protein KDD30_15305 [Photobacterium sp. GJ3]|uniref:hypothetical protein n=1 Tax=Photobacterium sp. GJ3 TaxID=2829502 RepID=UPI001B8AED3F|nr:hypothetical protein [Photobacterium sp. GJ3]QUJ67382.1 hypothetical protein KDD30_15305 [Photobacterium sp. GJ3]